MNQISTANGHICIGHIRAKSIMRVENRGEGWLWQKYNTNQSTDLIVLAIERMNRLLLPHSPI